MVLIDVPDSVIHVIKMICFSRFFSTRFTASNDGISQLHEPAGELGASFELQWVL